jgi:hypothetical protein
MNKKFTRFLIGQETVFQIVPITLEQFGKVFQQKTLHTLRMKGFLY